ncbi:hypothetical protein EV384_1221 [Micromonospora kangleipakensis]|uniref:Uncharacterized protein n=1 Tax=Micromonospora kangleipakensis TaxID=1077942 RepID=A0A4Q8B5J3_9ACTN|nr:hypothetical protein EV384_1221 [Micromonospora kangleipakensis]
MNGIGEKTAAKLLAAMGSVNAALADPHAAVAAIGKAAAGKLTTAEARAALDRNRDLMAIRRDVPVDPAACQPAVTADTVAAVLRDRHLRSLVDRVAAALCRPALPSSPPRRREQSTVVPEPLTEDAGPLPMAQRDQPAAPALERADPSPVCPSCGREAAAALPFAQLDDSQRPVLTGGEILVHAEHPVGDLLAVLVDGVWAVRRIQVGEYYLPPGNRRRAHYCQTYPFECAVPGCGEPARMYACGPRCDRHPPAPGGWPSVGARNRVSPLPSDPKAP